MALLLALAMMPMVAFAAEADEGAITINNAIDGKEYSAYQILQLESYNAETGAYSYTQVPGSPWNEWLNGDAVNGKYLTFENGYAVQVPDADFAAFASEAMAYAKAKEIAPTAGPTTAASGTVSFENLPLGYYLVDSSVGTICSLGTTNPNATITEKNDVPTNAKEVQENSTGNWGSTNDAKIGDPVQFRSTITGQPGTISYVFTDTMSKGLSFNNDIVITRGGETVAADGNYAIAVTSTVAGETVFTITFTDAFVADFASQAAVDAATNVIVVSYSATLTSDAVIGMPGNPNKSELSYSNGDVTLTTPASETKTYAWPMEITKFTMRDGAETLLAGAEFSLALQGSATPIRLVPTDVADTYRVATATDENPVTTITTTYSGKLYIQGLDAGNYQLTEVNAPEGYNKLAGPVAFTINGTTAGENMGQLGGDFVVDNINIKVENKTGLVLPSTGGIGTIIFTVVGAVIIIGAVAFLFARRRHSKSE